MDAVLHRADLVANPFSQFRKWYTEMELAGFIEPSAMTLATASGSAAPSLRTVLLKGFDEESFQFFTNYRSRKARELDANPQAALLFYWDKLQRQVRIEGRAERLSAAESDAYFATRPRRSQLGAWASQQSEPLVSRAVLEAQMESVEANYAGRDVPRPAHWGGFRLMPQQFEFWQGRRNRLHDRFIYTRVTTHDWQIERLFP